MNKKHLTLFATFALLTSFENIEAGRKKKKKTTIAKFAATSKSTLEETALAAALALVEGREKPLKIGGKKRTSKKADATRNNKKKKAIGKTKIQKSRLKQSK